MDSEELGKQLRCPSGEYALDVGENMFLSNSNMIFKTIDKLDIKPHSNILEIGIGIGKHVPILFEKHPNIDYHGIDTSEAMIAAASLHNAAQIENKKAVFSRVSGDATLNFENDRFDYCFTVNTIYFWRNVQEQFNEIYRVLKPNGKIATTFIDKEFGKKLPFTQKEFVFYEIDEVEIFLRHARFVNIHSTTYNEQTTGKHAERLIRPFTVILGSEK